MIRSSSALRLLRSRCDTARKHGNDEAAQFPLGGFLRARMDFRRWICRHPADIRSWLARIVLLDPR